MKPYKYIEHTSDLFIEGSGRDLKEAIEAVAQGLFNSCLSASPSNSFFIEFNEFGMDLQDLIINIFTKVLAEIDARSKTGCALEIMNIDDKAFTAHVRLGLCDAPAKLGVKAVTFHGFSIKHENGRTILRILFDI